MLSQVLLLTGILWLHAATESQSHLAIAFAYRDPAKVTGKYVSLCLKKAQKSLSKGTMTLYIFHPYQKFIVFVSV